MWNDLNMKQKADVISMAVKAGLKDMDSIRSFYNESIGKEKSIYQSGGGLKGGNKRCDKVETDQCATWSNGLLRKNGYAISGNAWGLNRVNTVFNGFDGLEKPSSYDRGKVEQYNHNATSNVYKYFDSKTLDTSKPYVVNMYYNGSPSQEDAYYNGKGVTGTHTGILTHDGKRWNVTHNIHGTIHEEPFISLQNKGNKYGVTAIYEPRKETLIDQIRGFFGFANGGKLGHKYDGEGEGTSLLFNKYKIPFSQPVKRNVINITPKPLVKGQSIIDKNKIYNRLPAMASSYPSLDPFGLSVGASALGRYYFGSDNYVDNLINNSKEVLEKLNSGELPKPKGNLTSEQRAYLMKEANNNILGLEDAKDIYLGIPQRSNTFEIADKLPTLGKLTNPHKSKYLSTDKDIMEKYLLPAYNNLLMGKVKGGDAFSKDFKPGDLFNIGNSGNNAVTALPILGNATIGKGVDPVKGPYVSYYDTWDVELNGNSGGKDNVVSNIIGGKPFDIYDRVYLDDYYGVNSAGDANTYTGGYLPEVKVLGTNRNKHRLGGFMDTPPSSSTNSEVVTDYPDMPRKFTMVGHKLVRETDEEYRQRYEQRQKYIERNRAISEERARRREEANAKGAARLNRAINTVVGAMEQQAEETPFTGEEVREAAEKQREEKLDKWRDIKLGLDATAEGIELLAAGYGALHGLGRLGRWLLNNKFRSSLSTSALNRINTLGGLSDTVLPYSSSAGSIADLYQFGTADNTFDRVDNGLESAFGVSGFIGSTDFFRKSPIYGKYGNVIDNVLDGTGYIGNTWDLIKSLPSINDNLDDYREQGKQ